MPTGGLYSGTQSFSVAASVFDTDLDTGIEVERTADDDIIRFISAGTDVGEWTTAQLKILSGAFWADGTTGVTPTSGAGTRMMWIPAKAAFRAGEVTGTEWDDANIGTRSVALGANAIASGLNSFAFGDNSVASGADGMSFGNTAVSASNGIAMGSNTTANTGGAIAIGPGCSATNFGSIVIGSDSSSSGFDSLALGRLVDATNQNSLVFGAGVSTGNELLNNITNSIMFGANSTIPTLFISASSGIGTVGQVAILHTNPATDLHIQENNTDTVPTQEIEQLGAGDAGLQFSIVGDAYAMGIDNSDADKFKISYANTAGNAVLGTNDRLVIDSSGNVGINISAPTSRFHCFGSSAFELTTITNSDSPYTVGDETTIIADATSGNITINLLAAGGVTDRLYNIKKIDSSVNTVTIDGSGTETIDDQLTAVISAQYTTLSVQSDGTEWWII